MYKYARSGLKQELIKANAEPDLIQRARLVRHVFLMDLWLESDMNRSEEIAKILQDIFYSVDRAALTAHLTAPSELYRLAAQERYKELEDGLVVIIEVDSFIRQLWDKAGQVTS